MTEDAYRDVIVQIIEAETGHDAGQWRGIEHLIAALTQQADLFAEAATLAPPEFTGAWTALATVNRRAAAKVRTGDASRLTREEIDAKADATRVLNAHVKDSYGLVLVASPG